MNTKVVTLIPDPHGGEMLKVWKVVATKCREVRAISRSPFHGYLFLV